MSDTFEQLLDSALYDIDRAYVEPIRDEIIAYHRNQIAERDARIADLTDVLREIAGEGTSQPAALNMPEEDWYRRIAWGLIRKAQRGLRSWRQ